MIIVKIIGIIVYFFLFFVKGFAISFFVADKNRRHRLHSYNTAHSCNRMAKLLGLDITLNNPDEWEKLKRNNYLVVSNHVSYLDIVIMTAINPFLFITSTDMKNVAFIGKVTELGGSLYTDRKKFTGIKGEITNFAQYLKDGFNVVLFPEATSTDGKELRKFKKSLYQIAIEANKPILPMCIKYTTNNGKPIDDSNRDNLYWYGDMGFLPHFWRLIKTRRTTIEITILDEIKVTPESNRKDLCEESFEMINSKYHSYKNL